MSAQVYTGSIAGTGLVAWIISTAGTSFMIVFATLAGVLLLSLYGGLAQSLSLPKLSLDASQKSARRYQTYRISNIPLSVTEDAFRKALVEIVTDENLGGFSCALAVASALASKYRVATVTFVEAPDITELQKTLRICFGRRASLLRVDSDFFGLTPLHSLPHVEDIKVDIVAVVGLAGHGFGTWKARGKPGMWLRDYLPDAVPNVRVTTYGYDTELPGSQSEKSIIDLSRNLLESIKTSRDETCKHRPLILAGHSLGGLVVKQALVQASEGSAEDKAVFASCFALLLFGVPNRGMDNTSLMAMVRGQPNEAIVRELSPSSRFLAELHRQFNMVFTLEDSSIISWYETKGTATIEYSEETGSFEKTNKFRMLVEHTSATHAGPNEKNYDQLSIDADHSDIVKFDNPSNPYYVVVAERVRKLVALGPEILANRLAERRRQLSEKEMKYIQLLRAPDYAALRKYKIANPAPNTLGWFLDKPELVRWKQSEASSLLWIQGSAGQGKTILAKFLLDYLETTIARAKGIIVIYFFFYEQDGSLRTIGSALRALIRQLLSARDVETFSAISEKVDLDGSQIDEVGLWDVLERLLTAPVLKKVFCVIDAIDEIPDTKQREELIIFLRKLTASSETKPSPPVLKTLMVSRPTIDIQRQLKESPTIILQVNPLDLQAFVHQELDFLRDQRDDEQHTTAVKMLVGRSERTFLWISLVVRRIKAAAMLTAAEINVIISKSPSELDEFYNGIVTDVMGRDGDIPKKLLLWAVYWKRPLTLAELEEAISVQHESVSIKSTLEHRLPLQKNKNNLSGAIGVIVNISDDNEVHLVHQSVKEFLVSSSHLKSAEFCRGLRPNLYLAEVCMLFLCFPDSEAEPTNDGRLGFLRYAAWNWHRHIESDSDGINTLRGLIAQVIAPKSQVLHRWARVAGLLASLGSAEGAWDIAMAANINWLGEFNGVASGGSVVDVERVTKAAQRRSQGYGPLLILAQRANQNFTDDAVCEMVRRFDQPMVRDYYDSHRDLPKTQALYHAALDNEEPVSMFRYLLDISKENEYQRPAKLAVDADFAHLLISSLRRVRPLYSNRFDVDNFHDPEKVRRYMKLCELLPFLVRSDAVEFDSRAWATLLTSQDCVNSDDLSYALESRQDCNWTNTFLSLAHTGSYPEVGEASMLQLLRECHGLSSVVDSEVTRWVGKTFEIDCFNAFVARITPRRVRAKDVVVGAVLGGNAALILLLLVTHTDEILGDEECIFHLVCETAATRNQHVWDERWYEKEEKWNQGEKWNEEEDQKGDPWKPIRPDFPIEPQKLDEYDDVDLFGKSSRLWEKVRWEKTVGKGCILWLLLVTGVGARIVVSDRALKQAKLRHPKEVANVLQQIHAEDTEIEGRHLAELLVPPLSESKRRILDSASPQIRCRDIRLTEEFAIRLALYKEVEALALVFQYCPDSLCITKDFLKAVVATADFLSPQGPPWGPYPTGNTGYFIRDCRLENTWRGASEVMEILLRNWRRGVESAICDEVCLTAASSGDCGQILSLLCEQERLIPMKNEWRTIARIRRAVECRAESLEPLLQHQTLLDTPDYWGISPLMVAVYRANIHLVRMLLESGGVDVNRADELGLTPLFWTYRIDCSSKGAAVMLSIVILLLRAGAQPDVVDHHGSTLLDWARKEGVFEMETIIEDVKQAQKRGLELEALFDKMLERAKSWDEDDSPTWDSMVDRPVSEPLLEESNVAHETEARTAHLELDQLDLGSRSDGELFGSLK